MNTIIEYIKPRNLDQNPNITNPENIDENTKIELALLYCHPGDIRQALELAKKIGNDYQKDEVLVEIYKANPDPEVLGRVLELVEGMSDEKEKASFLKEVCKTNPDPKVLEWVYAQLQI